MGDDFDDIWGAINELRDGQRAMLVSQGRIEAMLGERCESRMDRIKAIETEQAKQREDIQSLKEHRSFSRGQQATLTAVGTVVGAAAGAAVSHLLGGK